MSKKPCDFTSLDEFSKLLGINTKTIENYKLLEKELKNKKLKYTQEKWESNSRSEFEIRINIYLGKLRYVLTYKYWDKLSSQSDYKPVNIVYVYVEK